MANSIKKDHILLAKFISGNITNKEKQKFEKWKTAKDSNLQLYNKTVEIWNKSSYFSKAEINDDRLKVQVEINHQLQSKIAKSSTITLIYKLVAILVIPIALAISWYIVQHSHSAEKEVQICKIISPKGNISKCILPDSTIVWINTNSTVSYDINSFNTDNREINLNGEAFFNVSKNKHKPFKVLTTLGDIKVTGTKFNIKACSGSCLLETTLNEGSIELLVKSNSQSPITLSPGERAVYNSTSNKITIKKVNTEIFSAWRKGEIIFKDATLADLILELERIYDIKFQLDDKKIGAFRFRGMFRYNNNLIDALEKIKKTADVDYQIKNKEVKLITKK